MPAHAETARAAGHEQPGHVGFRTLLADQPWRAPLPDDADDSQRLQDASERAKEAVAMVSIGDPAPVAGDYAEFVAAWWTGAWSEARAALKAVFYHEGGEGRWIFETPAILGIDRPAAATLVFALLRERAQEQADVASWNRRF